MAEIREIKSIDELNEFVSLGKDGNISVLKFGAPWCGPCRTLEDTLRGLTDDEVNGVLLGEVNVDDEWFEDEVTRFHIRGIPVLVAFKDGVEAERIVGGAPKDKVIGLFNDASA